MPKLRLAGDSVIPGEVTVSVVEPVTQPEVA